MGKLFKKFIAAAIRHPLLVIIFISSLSLGALYFIPNIKMDNSIDVFFDKNSSSYINFQNWKEQFGSDQIIIVAFRDKNIFTEKNLKLITRLTQRFESLKYIEEVTSLINVNDIAGDEGDFIVRPLIEEVPSTREGLDKLRQKALANPLYVKNLISSQGTTTAIVLELEHKQQGADTYKKEVMQGVLHILKEEFPPRRSYYVSGLAAVEFSLASYMQNDLKKFLPMIFLIIIVIIFLSFRSIKAVFLLFFALLASLLLTMAFLYFCGFSINNITTIIPPIMLAIAVADSIHFLGETVQRKSKFINGREDDFLFQTIKHLAYPCFLTTLTTAVGFFSLTVSRVPPVRELGLIVGTGIIFAFIITFTFIPALVKKFNFLKTQISAKRKDTNKRRYEDISIQSLREEKSKFFGQGFDKFLIGIGRFNERFSFWVLISTLGLVFLSGWGMSRIKVDTSVIEYFKKKSPIHKSTSFIEQNLSGIHTLNISLKADNADYFKQPAALKKIEKLQQFLITLPEVDKVTSCVDYLKEINKSFHNEDSRFYVVPSSKKLIAQYLLLYGARDLDDFIDSRWQWANVRLRLNEHSTLKLKKVIYRINDYLGHNFDLPLKREIVGQTVLEVETNDAVTRGQIYSLGLAMLVIFVMMFAVFRSVSVGLISIVPNVLPLLVNFGIMGLLGFRLDSATSMISVIGVGIIVDDTIHFLHSFKEALKETENYRQAVYKSLARKGRPIILTSLILFFGFGVVAFSQFVPSAYFGLLSALLMFNALWADLIVLPCLLLWIKPKFK